MLGEKYKYGLTLPRKILNNQLISATDGYRNVFSQILYSVLGGHVDEYGTIYYNATVDKVVVGKIAQAVSSVLRGAISMNIPALTVSDSELQAMLTGNDNVGVRLLKIKQYISNNAESLPQLASATGEITNALLRYLQPAVSTEYGAIAGVRGMESAMNIPTNTNSQLVSAFDDLLSCEDPVVRDFAEYLIKYTYNTTFDMPATNALF
jgi:hypothetical protein